MALCNFSQVGCPRSAPFLVGRKGNKCCGVLEGTTLNVKKAQYPVSMTSSHANSDFQNKLVWIWTESKEVMTCAVEKGWNTFIFASDNKKLANEWSSLALINPLFVRDAELLDVDNNKVASLSEISSPKELQLFQIVDDISENLVISLLDWQVIPAENIVAAFQGSHKRVLAIAKSSTEAQIFFEVLEHGLDGIVLKVEEKDALVKLKEYFDRREEGRIPLTLSRVIVTLVKMIGKGDRVCVDLCSLMKPGEGLLVGSFAGGLFLVHSECQESDYIASRPFRVNAGPVHAYVAIPGGRTCYLSELKAGKEVIIVDGSGHQRVATVGRVKIESRSLILVEAKEDLHDEHTYSIFLQNAETVALVRPSQGDESRNLAIPVTQLKVGDEVLLRLQGGARHTGIEIEEFVLEK